MILIQTFLSLVIVGYSNCVHALGLIEVKASRNFDWKLQLSTTRDISIEDSISFQVLRGKSVLVVGGNGRVGGSVVTQILRHGGLVTVGGTSVERFQESKKRWTTLFPDMVDAIETNIDFAILHRENEKSVSLVLRNHRDGKRFDLVVHTAGPFQGKIDTPNGVLGASVKESIPYIDVCDDYCTAKAAKHKYSKEALGSGVPCIISTGCWPGVSSLMAKQLTDKILQQNPSMNARDLKVDFSFFTAGSGGAGATLLLATFLILSEKALTIVCGRRRPVQAMKEYKSANFGKVVGYKEVAHLNLLETASM